MAQIFVGDPTITAELAADGADDDQSRIWPVQAPETALDPSSSAALAEALTGFEAKVTGQEPALVVLADDSEHALAAALVATKLLIPVAALPGAREPSSSNGRLIAQLADSYTRPA